MQGTWGKPSLGGGWGSGVNGFGHGSGEAALSFIDWNAILWNDGSAFLSRS